MQIFVILAATKDDPEKIDKEIHELIEKYCSLTGDQLSKYLAISDSGSRHGTGIYRLTYNFSLFVTYNGDKYFGPEITPKEPGPALDAYLRNNSGHTCQVKDIYTIRKYPLVLMYDGQWYNISDIHDKDDKKAWEQQVVKHYGKHIGVPIDCVLINPPNSE
jgi:hypothetical protein